MCRIRLTGVSKTYQGKKVLQDVSLELSKGTSYVLLGRNGCGKSTLLRIIAGITVPDEGEVGYCCDELGSPLKFAYVPERMPALAITGRSYLRHMGAMDEIPKEELNRKIDFWADAFFMEDMLDTPMKQMSKGTLQKIGVIQALLCKPDVLLMDEPLSGQDMESGQVFVSQIRRMKEEGTTVVTACHERWLAETLAEKIIRIEERKVTVREQDALTGLRVEGKAL